MIAWLFIAALWTISFVFAGIEAGLLAADRVRLRHFTKQAVPAALRLTRLLAHPERLLVTVLLVTNMADISALLLVTHRFVRSLGALGYIIALLVALPVHLFLLSVLPKALFRRFPLRALAALAGVLELAQKILSPLLSLGQRLSAMRFLRRIDEPPRLFAAREELKQITTQSEREGTLTSAERVLIHNVVDFRAVAVRDVMVALPQVIAIHPETPLQEALVRSRDTGVDRLPVISAQGEPLGLVNILDVLLDTSTAKPLRSYIRRMVTAREDEPAYRVIQRLRAARLSLAAVTDADRRLTGIVTGEDLVRRLVQTA